jgi:hypothetical protein
VKSMPFFSFSISLLLVVGAGEAHAQRAQDVLCTLSPVMPNYSPFADHPPTVRTAKDMKKLVGLLCPQGCGRVALFQNPTIPSALTVNAGSGNSRIEYSAAFLDKVRELFGEDARMGILAHEFGHHVDQNSVRAAWVDPSWNSELRADSWAGCALAKLGMRTQGVKDALRAIAATQSSAAQSSATQVSKIDPAWDQRWVAVQAGYDGCAPGGGKLAAFESAAVRVSARGGGCASNADCRMGRLCIDGRCENQSLARGLCAKDVDCPEGLLCTAMGRCDTPAGSGQLVAASALTASPGRHDPRACRKECGVERKQCRVGAMKTLNDCLRGITSDRSYKECLCPNWPSNKPACHQVCEDAFDKADQCESDYSPGKEACVAEAPACKDCL